MEQLATAIGGLALFSLDKLEGYFLRSTVKNKMNALRIA